MSNRPTDLPEWASGGGADIVTPSTGKKATGWTGGEKPPAQYVNWLQHTIYLWLRWIFEGVLQRSDVSDNTPVLATCDRAANVRSWIDASGYTNGPAICEQYVWGPRRLTSITTDGNASSKDRQLAVYTHAQSSITIVESTRSNAPCLRINTVASTSVSEGAIVANGPVQPVSNIPNTVITWESSFELSFVSDTCAYFFGLSDLGAPAGAPAPSRLSSATSNGCLFLVDSGASTELFVQNTNGVARSVSGTGVTLANNTRYQLRVELHGANTPVGVNAAAPVARYFVNGVLAHEETGTGFLPTSANLGSCIGARRDATNVGSALIVGTTRLNYNDVLDSSANVPA